MLPLIVPEVAVIDVVKLLITTAGTTVARPVLAPIVATPGVPLVQVTEVVMLAVVLSE